MKLHIPASLRLRSMIAGLFFAAFAALAWAGGLEGTLSGTVMQSDNRANYRVEMKLDGEHGSVDYPSLHCGGTLALLRVERNVYWYRENITYGADHCYDGGMIGLAHAKTGEPDNWVWHWEGFGVTVEGIVSGKLSAR